MTNTERLLIDYANLSPATAQLLGDGQLPPLPIIQGLMWQPPSQTAPTVEGTLPGRLMIYADADHRNWQEYVPDVPNAPNLSPSGGSTLMDYWPGYAPANYVLTKRSYWALVPNTYTQVHPGGSFQKQYSTTVGISTTDAQTISAELGVGVDGLSAKLSAEFSHSVTTESSQTDTTTYNVEGADGLIRVWMLWQLVDEIVALDPTTGDVVANPTQRGDVNWSGIAPTGAYLHYTNLHQHFPEPIFAPLQKDFPS